MSTKKGHSTQTKLQIGKRRIFSESFKRQQVSDLNAGLVKVKEIVELYQVSYSAVYKWIYKYSPHHEEKKVTVVQMESEVTKLRLLQSRVQELEAALGRKQLEIEYLNKLIDIANEDYQTDLKKNYG